LYQDLTAFGLFSGSIFLKEKDFVRSWNELQPLVFPELITAQRGFF
jgi:hypothetical protein